MKTKTVFQNQHFAVGARIGDNPEYDWACKLSGPGGNGAVAEGACFLPRLDDCHFCAQHELAFLAITGTYSRTWAPFGDVKGTNKCWVWFKKD